MSYVPPRARECRKFSKSSHTQCYLKTEFSAILHVQGSDLNSQAMWSWPRDSGFGLGLKTYSLGLGLSLKLWVLEFCSHLCQVKKSQVNNVDRRRNNVSLHLYLDAHFTVYTLKHLTN